MSQTKKNILNKLITDFQDNINGLRDFVELIKPFLKEHSLKTVQEHAQALIPVSLAVDRHFEQNPERKEEITSKLKSLTDGDIEILEAGKAPGEGDIKIKFTSGDAISFNNALAHLAKTYRQEELLYKNSLISLLSSVEWFFSQLLHFYYDQYPDSAGIKNKTLTLEELKLFDSVRDAENYLIDDKIEKVLRGSLKDWIDTLKNDFKLGLGYFDSFYDDLTEVFQRRNLLVHNGGIINSIYLSKVADKFKQDISIGDKIVVNEHYLEHAINKYHVSFTLIACEVWKKISPEDEVRSKILIDLAYDYLCIGDWEISSCANTFLANDKKMPVASRTAAELNIWLCRKRILGYEKIEKDLSQLDYSDKALIFQVALYALKGDKESFFRHLPQVIKTEELRLEDLFDFPILEEMRQTEEFEQFKQENELVKNYLLQKSVALSPVEDND